jgi:hypothetical protein
MATFEGTIQEFHEYLGPRIRNKINNLTRRHRILRRGVCEECGKLKELHSAHIHGRERRGIIEEVLSEYITNGLVRFEIGEIEGKILQEHLPLEENFKYLCHNCHVQYDQQQKKEKISDRTQLRSKYKNINIGQNNRSEQFIYLHRIRLWATRPGQYNHKIIKAYISLERNGPVYLENLRGLCSDRNSQYFVDTFGSNYTQMKTDLGHPHGKVFFDDGVIVNIYPIVRGEIRKWFGE